MEPPEIVDESNLGDYRSAHLNPLWVGMEVQAAGGVTLLSVPPGVGKSHTAHSLPLIAHLLGYDAVFYMAATRELIDEFVESDSFRIVEESHGELAVLGRRPGDLCGPLDTEWRQMEASGCAALARDQLCANCPHVQECEWPSQMNQITPNTFMVVLTEAYASLKPGIIPELAKRCSARNPLVIIDEGTIFTTNTSRTITVGELEMFSAALNDIHRQVRTGSPQAVGIAEWIEGIASLLQGKDQFKAPPNFDPWALRGFILGLQRSGIEQFGRNFRDIRHDLSAMRNAWYHAGAYHYAPLIETGSAEVIVLSPNMNPGALQARLGRKVIPLPVPNVFRHTKSRFINIRDNSGSARSMANPADFNRIVDFHTALTLRNHTQGRRTVLVARKKFLEAIKDRVEETATAVGFSLSIALPGDEITENTSVAIINYGIVGSNAFQDFDALYSVGSFYAQPDHVGQVYQQAVPHQNRQIMAIRSEAGKRCPGANAPTMTARGRANGARPTLDLLERRIVIQAVGRIRPFTSPGDVIIMQDDHFGDVFDELIEYPTLKRARDQGGVPTRAELLRSALGDQLRAKMGAGVSMRTAAKLVGCAPSTASKALSEPGLLERLEGITL